MRLQNVLVYYLYIYRNYDSTASLESFFLQEGVEEGDLDGFPANDISDIIDAGNEIQWVVFTFSLCIGIII